MCLCIKTKTNQENLQMAHFLWGLFSILMYSLKIIIKNHELMKVRINFEFYLGKKKVVYLALLSSFKSGHLLHFVQWEKFLKYKWAFSIGTGFFFFFLPSINLYKKEFNLHSD